MKPTFRTKFDRVSKKKMFEDHSLTKQSFKADSDINNIVKRYTRLGQSLRPNGHPVGGVYGDFADVGTYQESIELVMHSQMQFMGLDSKIRARFDNDPAKFLAFATDPANLDEMRSMGLAKPKEKAPEPGAVAPPGGAPSPAGDKKEPAGGGTPPAGTT